MAKRIKKRPLTVEMILAWADAHHERTGRWPAMRSGPIPGTVAENWRNIQQSLYDGYRGLSGGSSLAKLLRRHRGRSAGDQPSPLTIKQILAWADAHHRHTGSWPRQNTGAVIGAPGEKWRRIDFALCQGKRGLPGEMTLAKLLFQRRSVFSPQHKPNTTLKQILKWADAYHRRTGNWPNKATEVIPEAPGRTWNVVRKALRQARYGLPNGWTLARLLAEHRSAVDGRHRPLLTHESILAWIDSHYRRTGIWPNYKSGQLPDASGETWSAIDNALRAGSRGLPGHESVAQLLAKHRGISPNARRPFLTTAAILSWADAYRQRTSAWPTSESGPIPEAPGECWRYIDMALRSGGRDLPKGLSL